MHKVEFWFDPACPWAWRASQWMREVETVRDVSVSWQLMSLAVLNEGLELSSEERELYDSTWPFVRVCAAAARRCGQGVLGELYVALGTRIHGPGTADQGLAGQSLISDALAEAGLPPDLVTAVLSSEYDADVRESHQCGQRVVGMTSGTPIVAVDGVGFHGPVISSVPKGEAAGQLFDGLVACALTPGFSELSRGRVD